MELAELAFTHFDRKVAYEAYDLWRVSDRTDRSLLDEAMHRTIPAIGFCIKVLFQSKRASFYDPSELVSAAAEKIFHSLSTAKFRGDEIDSYHRYIMAISRFAITDCINSWKRPEFDFNDCCRLPPIGHLVSHRDMDLKIYIDKLPSVVEGFFKRTNRLQGDEGKAAYFILKRTIANRGVPKSLIFRYYGFSKEKIKFLMDYVTILVRQCLYEIRDVLEEGVVVDDWMDLAQSLRPEYEPDLYHGGYPNYLFDTDVEFA